MEQYKTHSKYRPFFILMNLCFALIDCNVILDEAKDSEIYKHQFKQIINKAEDETAKMIGKFSLMMGIDDDAILQFIINQRELSKLMADIDPERRMQMTELAKLWKENPAKFNTIAVASGYKIITK